jgi:hypothetical protein
VQAASSSENAFAPEMPLVLCSTINMGRGGRPSQIQPLDVKASA